MITSYLDYAENISRAIHAKPLAVYVSSFNLNTGVSARGTTYPTPTYAALTELNKSVAQTFVMVGPPPARRDFSLAIACSQERWPRISFRILPDLHLKCWIFRYKKYTQAIVGGRNLGDSQWHDASWWLNQKDSKQLLEYYVQLWDRGEKVVVNKSDDQAIYIGNKRIV